MEFKETFTGSHPLVGIACMLKHYDGKDPEGAIPWGVREVDGAFLFAVVVRCRSGTGWVEGLSTIPDIPESSLVPFPHNSIESRRVFRHLLGQF